MKNTFVGECLSEDNRQKTDHSQSTVPDFSLRGEPKNPRVTILSLKLCLFHGEEPIDKGEFINQCNENFDFMQRIINIYKCIYRLSSF